MLPVLDFALPGAMAAEENPAKKSKVEWESTATFTGTITNTTSGGGNGGNGGKHSRRPGGGINNDNVTVKPVYESFSVTAKAFVIK